MPKTKPRSLKGLLLRRLSVLIPMALLAMIVVRLGWLDRLVDKVQFDRLAWFDNTKLVQHLRTVASHRGLTALPGKCLIPLVHGDDPPTATRIDFMQRGASGCPGPSNRFERLFTIIANRTARTLSTDAGSPGRFHSL